MDPGQYIRPPSSESSLLAKEVIRCWGWHPRHVQGLQVCQAPQLGQLLSKLLCLRFSCLLFYRKSQVCHIRGLCFRQLYLFYPSKCALKMGVLFFFIVSVCCTCALLFYMCYFVSGHILEMRYVGWLNHIMAQILSASFQLLAIAGGLHSYLNEVYVRFRSSPLLSFCSSSLISLHLVCSCDFLQLSSSL